MPASEHYFTAEPAAARAERRVRFRFDDRTVTLRSAAGVFSADRIDLGTQVLLRAAPQPTGEGPLLDLGCGYGPIACALALRAPDAVVWAVDVNSRARELAAANAADLGLARVRVAAPDQVPADVRFAAIYSNPPVRIGKAALHDLLLQWLPRLAPTGSAYLVVARNLGSDSLQRWLAEHGWPTERLGSERGYRVLGVRTTWAACCVPRRSSASRVCIWSVRRRVPSTLAYERPGSAPSTRSARCGTAPRPRQLTRCAPTGSRSWRSSWRAAHRR
jgi:16S rRNA (guanine1207-N2)-methyltransferase